MAGAPAIEVACEAKRVPAATAAPLLLPLLLAPPFALVPACRGARLEKCGGGRERLRVKERARERAKARKSERASERARACERERERERERELLCAVRAVAGARIGCRRGYLPARRLHVTGSAAAAGCRKQVWLTGKKLRQLVQIQIEV